MFNVEKIRRDFPILSQQVNDEPLIYLDNAATTHLPVTVRQRLENYYQAEHSNVHRGVHTLSSRATTAYEESREQVRAFIGARSTREVLFTRGTTTSLNWLAQSYGDVAVSEGDEILLSPLEHHANLVPWQQLAKRKKAKLVFLKINHAGEVDLVDLKEKLSSKTKIVSLTHVSNVLGNHLPIKKITRLVHQAGAVIVVDGAQAIPHQAVDVSELGVDFYVFSGHKMLAPTGIGVLYGKEKYLEQMEPVEFGGEMIEFVSLEESTWTELPWKFETGTPNIAGAIGLGSAIEYLNQIGMQAIEEHEKEITAYLVPRLQAIEGLTLYGPTNLKQRSSVFSFNLTGIHPHDVATALDMQGVAVRAGHHCAQPLMRQLDVSSTVRASFYLYNTKAEADKLVSAIEATKEFFQHGTV